MFAISKPDNEATASFPDSDLLLRNKSGLGDDGEFDIFE